MEKKWIALAVAVVVVLIVALVFWGRKEMGPPSRAALAHGSVTLPATGVPPMGVSYGAAPAAGQPAPATPADVPGAPSSMKAFVKEHPRAAEKIMKEKTP